MEIYCAHPLTREYLGPSRAEPDPLEPDSWLIPACAYVDAPPVVPNGYAAQRLEDGTAWQLVIDHRGIVYSTATGVAQQYLALGDLPDGLTTEARPSEFHFWESGVWMLDDAARLAAEESAERTWRDSQMGDLFGKRDRHRDEVDLGIATTLTVEQFAELLGYIQQLRDWPQSAQFPVVEYRPSPPAWLAAE